ncbi:MAG: Flp pilus assembly protein CpaB [Gammaproteobacteria bacterium]|nr:Flp pilus assembly protein CpaB [Gammaproteobacteria bacterium]
MLSRRGPILIVMSLILAAAAAWFALEYMKSLEAKKEATPGTVPVAIAAMDIPFGTKVEARHVGMIQMLEGTAPKGNFPSAAEVEGKVARDSIMQGEILLAPQFTAEGEGSTLATVITENMRAVSIRVNDVVGVAGFLLPGNRVDVVSAYRDGTQTRSETIVQNVKVLAVDQTASTEKNEPVVVRAVTLEVTPDDAEKLALAAERGAIQLALRNPADDRVAMRGSLPLPPAASPIQVAAEPVKTSPVKAKPRVRIGPPPPDTSVTVIRGTSVGKEVAPKGEG